MTIFSIILIRSVDDLDRQNQDDGEENFPKNHFWLLQSISVSKLIVLRRRRSLNRSKRVGPLNWKFQKDTQVLVTTFMIGALLKRANIFLVGRHSSVDPSMPTIPWSRVCFPCAYLRIFIFIWIVKRKGRKDEREAGNGP